jgi:hypothetical protein
VSQTLTTLVLLDAIDILAERERWITRTVREGDRYCAIGALILAAYKLTSDTMVVRALVLSAERQVVVANSWNSDIRLAHYNDHHSHDDVLDAMMRGLLV